MAVASERKVLTASFECVAGNTLKVTITNPDYNISAKDVKDVLDIVLASGALTKHKTVAQEPKEFDATKILKAAYVTQYIDPIQL